MDKNELKSIKMPQESIYLKKTGISPFDFSFYGYLILFQASFRKEYFPGSSNFIYKRNKYDFCHKNGTLILKSETRGGNF